MITLRWTVRYAAALVVATALAGCAPSKMAEVEKDLEAGRPEAASEKLEQLKRQPDGLKPRDELEARLALAEAYYVKARRELDQGDEQAYMEFLGKAQDQLISAVEVNPADDRPHLWMGIIAAYRGDLDTALENFNNARRLAPLSAVSYTNLAHIWVYKGNISAARSLLDKGRKLRAPQDELDRIEILAAWRAGDFVEARDVFNMALAIPRFAETWDGAPLPEAMEDFDDFARVCCGNPTCGPNMGSACRLARQEVAKREREVETVREELRLEMERRRRLREIYERRRDIEVTIEEPGAEPPASE